jgi:hypothetical protein
MRSALGPRRPGAGDPPQQTTPPADLSQQPQQTVPNRPPLSESFKAYLSALRRHEEALIRIRKKSEEPPPRDGNDERP